MLLLVSAVTAVVAVTVAVAPISDVVSLLHPPPQAEEPSILLVCTAVSCTRFIRIQIAVVVVVVVVGVIVACCTGGDGAVVVCVNVVSRDSSGTIGVAGRHDLLLLLIVLNYDIECLMSLCPNLVCRGVCVCVCVCLLFAVLIYCTLFGCCCCLLLLLLPGTG